MANYKKKKRKNKQLCSVVYSRFNGTKGVLGRARVAMNETVFFRYLRCDDMEGNCVLMKKQSWRRKVVLHQKLLLNLSGCRKVSSLYGKWKTMNKPRLWEPAGDGSAGITNQPYRSTPPRSSSNWERACGLLKRRTQSRIIHTPLYFLLDASCFSNIC